VLLTPDVRGGGDRESMGEDHDRYGGGLRRGAVHTAEHEPVGVLDQVTLTLGEGGNGSSGPGYGD
jgi:hypothetical protein